MLKPEPSLTDDESVLDDLFERALARFEAGHDVDVATLLGERHDLRAAAEDVLQIARDVAVNVDREPRVVPQRLGNYELVRPLGRGGAGVVYLARQLSVGGRHVALKVLPILASTDARARLLGEARALGKVRHPNIVAVHDVLDVDGLVAYAMEWIEGATLAQVVDAWRTQPFDVAADDSLALDEPPRTLASRVMFVCTIGSAIARALGVVHRAGLLHRDVKPSNILLRRDWTPLLSDFGLVRDEDASLATRSGQFLGTAAYAAPEQLRGDLGAIVPASDVFGLAATLYEALALRPPYPGRTILDILMRAQQGSPERLRKRVPDVPRDLEVVLEKALAPDPRDRYATADEFADELDRILTLEPIRARPPTIAARVRSLARRHRAITAAIAVTVIAVAGPLAWLAWDARSAPEREREARSLLLDVEFGLIDTHTLRSVERIAMNHPRAGGVQAPPDSLEKRRARVLNDLKYVSGLRVPADVRLEAEATLAVVEVATELVERKPVVLREVLAQSFPGTTASIKALVQPSSPQVTAESDLSNLDRRLQGLLAYLVGDTAAALEAWTPLTREVPSDPIANLLVGHLHLMRGDAWEARELLRLAAERLPNSKLAWTLLTSAAIATDDLDSARKWLEYARPLEFEDPFRTFERVHADLLAAQGDMDSAKAEYLSLVRTGRSQELFAGYSRFLALYGDFEQSLEWAELMSREAPNSVMAQRELLTAGARWWREVAGKAPANALERRFERGASQGSTSRELLCRLDATAAWLDAREPSRAGGRPSEEFVPAATRELWRRAALDPEAWSRMVDWPRPARHLQCWLWAYGSAWVADAVHRSLDLPLSSRVRRLERGAFDRPAATNSASAPRRGEWVSRWNGPDNAARAVGVVAGDEWRELWRTPCVGPEPLIHDGIVYFQDEPNDRTRFAGRSITNGAVVFGPIACAVPTSDPPSTGCIADECLVLPLPGRMSDRVTPSRIECWPLRDFPPRRRWCWNHAGMAGCASDLQVVELADGATCVTTRFSMARFGDDNVALLLSIATDGTFVEELRPTIHDASGVDWSTAAVVPGLGWIRQDYEPAEDRAKLAWNLRALEVRSLEEMVPDLGVPPLPVAPPAGDGVQPVDIERIQVDGKHGRVFLVDPDGSVLSFDVIGSGLGARFRISAPAGTVAVRIALAADVDRLFVAAAQSTREGRSWSLRTFAASTGAPMVTGPINLLGEAHFDVVCDGGIVLVSSRDAGIVPLFPDGTAGAAISTVERTHVLGRVVAAVPGALLVRDEDQLIAYQPTRDFGR